MRWFGLRAFGSALLGVALASSGCGNDTTNPFDLTNGDTGSSSGTGTPDGDDNGPGSLTAVDSTVSTSGDPDSTSTVAIDDSTDGSGTTMGVLDTGDSSTSTGDPPVTTDPSESSSSTDDGTMSTHIPCPFGEIPNAPLPTTVNGSTQGQTSEFGGTCGGGGAPDVAYLFTAPADGDYTFDTQGSSFDTVLYVLDGECGGAQMMCNDDGLVGTIQSMGSVPMIEGQTVTVVVDAFGLSGGNFTLTAREGSVTCPIDIGSTVPQVVAGQNVVATDEFTVSCNAGGTARDTAFTFTAPQAGTYTFEISNNTFDTLMSILNGTCSGPEVGCNDNLIGATGGASGLFLPLNAGQTITIVVEGYWGATGTFDLNVGVLDGACPDDDLGSTPAPFSVNGTTAGGDNATAGTCGGLSSNDHAYTWTAPANGQYSFSTAGSGFDTVLYVRDGTCTGAQLGCSNDAQGQLTSNVIASVFAGQTVVIVVDGFGASGPYTLTVSEAVSSGNCCYPHAAPGGGCVDPGVAACVCANNPGCCLVSWTNACANAAINQCGALCP